jgi:hypothetical protein
VIENKRVLAKGGPKKKQAKKPPPGFVGWDQRTFERLTWSPPETLQSQFRMTHGMLVSLLQRGEEDEVRGSGYRLAAELVGASHETVARKRGLRRHAAAIFRSLRRAALIQRIADLDHGGARIRVSPELQRDFSLHHSLSPYLLDVVAVLDRDHPDYAVDLLSVVEAILENPRQILMQQVDRAKGELIAKLKAEGVPYEERIAKLDEVTHPKPLADFLYATFAIFAEKHPWAAEENVRPKSIAREMWEHFDDFADFVRRYGIERSEGLLLRYLSQVHNTLQHSVPETAYTDDVHDLMGWLRALLGRVDSSLVEEWESLVNPNAPRERAAAAPKPHPFDLARHPKALAARIRAELQQLVRALSQGRWEDAPGCVRDDSDDRWDAERFESALAPFLAEYGRIVFDPRARLADQTAITPEGPRRWRVQQTLLDPAGDNLWAVVGEVDLTEDKAPEGPLVRIQKIGA